MRPRAQLTAGLVTLLVVGTLVASAQAQKFKTFVIPDVPVAITASGEVVGSGYIRNKAGKITAFQPPDYPCGDTHCRKPRQTVTKGINAQGDIAGYFYVVDVPIEPNSIPSFPHLSDGFIRRHNGTYSVFHVPGDYTHANGINASGQVVGQVNPDLASPVTAFLRQQDGTVEMYYDSRYIAFIAINNGGKVAGWSTLIGPFLRETDGTIVPYSVAGASSVTPKAINAAGVILGQYFDDLGNVHGYVRESNGVITSFDVPNATNTWPADLNSKGTITGVYMDSSSQTHGFVRDKKGNISTFDVPNSVSTNPTAINASGDITGWYSDGTGAYGFILSKK